MSSVFIYYTLTAECPECGDDADLTDQDYEAAYTAPIFENRWDDLKGETIECPNCEHEFTISGVEC